MRILIFYFVGSSDSKLFISDIFGLNWGLDLFRIDYIYRGISVVLVIVELVYFSIYFSLVNSVGKFFFMMGCELGICNFLIYFFEIKKKVYFFYCEKFISELIKN